MSARIRPAATVVAAVVALTGCHLRANDTPDRTAEKVSQGPVRTDPEPLTTRFPALGTPTSAHWQSGHYGSDRAPGPSLLWIDAAVVVDGPTARRLTRLTDTGEAAAVVVVPEVQAKLPAGPWRSGDALDAALSSDR